MTVSALKISAVFEPKVLWLIARVALTAGLLIVLWNAADGAEITRALTEASPLWLAAAVVTLVLQTALSAQRWRVTAAQLGQTLSTSYVVREYFLSQVFNQTLPGAIVGDAARAVRAREQGGLVVAGQAVFFERLAGQIAMFLMLSVAFLSTLWMAGGLEWPPALSAGLLSIVCAGALVVACLLLLHSLQHQTVVVISRWLQPLSRALLSRRVLPAQIGLGFAILVCNLMAFAFAAKAVGIDMSFAEITALVPVILFAMLVPLTVSGWGVREGAAAVLLPIAGISASSAVAASIIFGLAIMISVIPGALLVVKR
ncbi:MAG: lysylphosphatidylglycerol synthase transmembrane domain-containing protein [Pseudomonadota bacterium]